MTEHASATIIIAETFIGEGKEGAILVIEPDWKAHPTDPHQTEYEKDARKLAEWLHKIFCGETIKALKRMI